MQVLLLAMRCLSLHLQRFTACSRQVLVVVAILLAGLCVVRAVVHAVLEVLHAVV